jgi:hypothetical protein
MVFDSGEWQICRQPRRTASLRVAHRVLRLLPEFDEHASPGYWR